MCKESTIGTSNFMIRKKRIKTEKASNTVEQLTHPSQSNHSKQILPSGDMTSHISKFVNMFRNTNRPADKRPNSNFLLYNLKNGSSSYHICNLRKILRISPREGIQFAEMLAAENKSLADINQIVDVFLELDMIQQCTEFLLDFLMHDRPPEGPLQTRLLEINLAHATQIADEILGRNVFTHYDRARVAWKCEKAGLIQRALENYTDICDIKRLIVQTHLLATEWIVEYFRSLSTYNALVSLKALISSGVRHNLELSVQISIKYMDRFTIKVLVGIFEACRSDEGLYYFLGSLMNTSRHDSWLQSKYIDASFMTGHVEEVEKMLYRGSIYNQTQMNVQLHEKMGLNQVREAQMSPKTPEKHVIYLKKPVHTITIGFTPCESRPNSDIPETLPNHSYEAQKDVKVICIEPQNAPIKNEQTQLAQSVNYEHGKNFPSNDIKSEFEPDINIVKEECDFCRGDAGMEPNVKSRTTAEWRVEFSETPMFRDVKIKNEPME